MSTNSLERHHAKWSDLPLFTHEQWIVTDQDIEAWTDLHYMRDLVDTIAAVSHRAGRTPAPFPPYFLDDSIVFDPQSQSYVPWPPDRAGQLIGDWRADREQVPA